MNSPLTGSPNGSPKANKTFTFPAQQDEQGQLSTIEYNNGTIHFNGPNAKGLIFSNSKMDHPIFNIDHAFFQNGNGSNAAIQERLNSTSKQSSANEMTPDRNKLSAEKKAKNVRRALSTSSSQYEFTTVVPIESAQQQLLQREEDAICTVKVIHGEMGVGKTFLMRSCLRDMKNNTADPPVVIHINFAQPLKSYLPQIFAKHGFSDYKNHHDPVLEFFLHIAKKYENVIIAIDNLDSIEKTDVDSRRSHFSLSRLIRQRDLNKYLRDNKVFNANVSVFATTRSDYVVQEAKRHGSDSINLQAWGKEHIAVYFKFYCEEISDFANTYLKRIAQASSGNPTILSILKNILDADYSDGKTEYLGNFDSCLKTLEELSINNVRDIISYSPENKAKIADLVYEIWLKKLDKAELDVLAIISILQVDRLSVSGLFSITETYTESARKKICEVMSVNLSRQFDGRNSPIHRIHQFFLREALFLESSYFNKECFAVVCGFIKKFCASFSVNKYEKGSSESSLTFKDLLPHAERIMMLVFKKEYIYDYLHFDEDEGGFNDRECLNIYAKQFSPETAFAILEICYQVVRYYMYVDREYIRAKPIVYACLKYLEKLKEDFGDRFSSDIKLMRGKFVNAQAKIVAFSEDSDRIKKAEVICRNSIQLMNQSVRAKANVVMPVVLGEYVNILLQNYKLTGDLLKLDNALENVIEALVQKLHNFGVKNVDFHDRAIKFSTKGRTKGKRAPNDLIKFNEVMVGIGSDQYHEIVSRSITYNGYLSVLFEYALLFKSVDNRRALLGFVANQLEVVLQKKIERDHAGNSHFRQYSIYVTQADLIRVYMHLGKWDHALKVFEKIQPDLNFHLYKKSSAVLEMWVQYAICCQLTLNRGSDNLSQNDRLVFQQKLNDCLGNINHILKECKSAILQQKYLDIIDYNIGLLPKKIKHELLLSHSIKDILKKEIDYVNTNEKKSREMINNVMQSHLCVQRRLSDSDKVNFKNVVLDELDVDHETIIIVGYSCEMAKKCLQHLRDKAKHGKYKYVVITGDEDLANSLHNFDPYIKPFHADWSHPEDVESILTSMHVAKVKSVFFFHEQSKYTSENLHDYVRKHIFAFHDIIHMMRELRLFIDVRPHVYINGMFGHKMYGSERVYPFILTENIIQQIVQSINDFDVHLYGSRELDYLKNHRIFSIGGAASSFFGLEDTSDQKYIDDQPNQLLEHKNENGDGSLLDALTLKVSDASYGMFSRRMSLRHVISRNNLPVNDDNSRRRSNSTIL